MILYKGKTEYNDLQVTRSGNIITLWSPSTVRQTAIDVTNLNLPYLRYARYTLPCLAFFQNPKSILVLGLGGGSIPMMLHHLCKSARIDVVEIDPEIQLIATKYFKFCTDSTMHLTIDDASHYIQESKKKFDIIVMDVFIGDIQPETSMTAEFFQLAKARISKGGVFVSNMTTGRGTHFHEKLKRISTVFKNIWLLPVEKRDNTIVFAAEKSISKFEIIKRAVIQQEKMPSPFQILKLAKKIHQIKSK